MQADWPALQDEGKLEYHVPAAFDATRPGFIYTRDEYDTSIQDHPVASRLPRPTAETSVYSDLSNLIDLARRKDGPKKLDDFLYSDEPQLSLHIVSFRDATLVSVSWLHTFMDAMALSAVLDAWVLVLNGREAEVPPVCNFAKDPLSLLGVAPTEPHALAQKQLTGFNLVLFSLRYVFDLVFYRDSQRTIYLAPQHLQSMKEAALRYLDDELCADTATDDDGSGTAAPPDPQRLPRPFLSDGDVLCAFITRLAVRHLPPASTQQVGMVNAFDLRRALASSVLPPSAGVCLSNAVFLVSAFGRVCDILARPLGFTAALVRRAIVEQGTAAQVDALAALTRTSVGQTGRPVVFGDGATRLVIFSNWTKAGFFALDFGAAVAVSGGGDKPEPGGDAGSAEATAKPSFVNLTGESSGLSPRGSWPILGREPGGGYWLQGNLRSDLWAKVEEELLTRDPQPDARQQEA